MISEAVFLVDQFDYRTALARLGLNGRVDYTDRNLIEKWFHTFKMRVDRFHNSWVGSQQSARNWIDQLCITTTITGRINRSMERHQLTRC